MSSSLIRRKSIHHNSEASTKNVMRRGILDKLNNYQTFCALAYEWINEGPFLDDHERRNRWREALSIDGLNIQTKDNRNKQIEKDHAALSKDVLQQIDLDIARSFLQFRGLCTFKVSLCMCNRCKG